MTAPPDSLLIGSVLDVDEDSKSCRIVFHGRILHTMDPSNASAMAQLRVYRSKSKTGSVKRVVDEQTLIGKDLFKKETDISKFVNLKVTVETDAGAIAGLIEGSFGASGQYRVRTEVCVCVCVCVFVCLCVCVCVCVCAHDSIAGAAGA